MTDHLPIFMNINIGPLQDLHQINKVANRYLYNDENFKKFQNYIRNESWSALTSNHINLITPDEAYNTFINKFRTNFDKSFISTPKIGTPRALKKCQPWLSFSIIKACRKKSRLLKIYKKLKR